MDLTIVAVYTICDDLLISLGHQDHQQAKMSDAEVMTTALVAARYFAGNQQTACAALKTLGYIPNMLGHSRFNRRLHRNNSLDKGSNLGYNRHRKVRDHLRVEDTKITEAGRGVSP